MFFGGGHRDSNGNSGSMGVIGTLVMIVLAGHLAPPIDRHAVADGDQPHPRVTPADKNGRTHQRKP